MAEASRRSGEEPTGIPAYFVQYLKAVDAAEQRAVVEAHPLLFTEDIVLALKDARAQINETMREVREACRMIDAVSGSLEYTGARVELQPSESKALLDEDTILHNFALSLARLLTARERAAPAVPSTTPPPPTDRGPAAIASGAGAPPLGTGTAWFSQPSLVLAVLSFLPAEEILMTAETVCRAWQTWLFLPDVSRFFWVGCVQREFPQQLAALLQTAGDDLYQSDWRSLAMLCVTEAAEASEDEEA
ncbi:hypothetical protein NESM_000522000 [Novymonas esmeraldas]|uniref:F-box domain-containing protein n=1 Tax=Novymonas esmeraldas TaxID=1808958 RepID=A0AAW0EPD4_9TRYP